MGSIITDRSVAQLIVTAFRRNIEYLRTVIPQLGQACVIRVIDFIGTVQHMNTELTFCRYNMNVNYIPYL